MGKINSRRKGRKGERKTCVIFEEWTSLEFDVVPASGGLRWSKAENITGDIICTDPLHRFDISVEVKTYKELNFDHIIIPGVNSKIMDTFWPQCRADAIRGKKIPLLFMRYDNIRPGNFYFACLPYYFFKLIKPLIKFESTYMKVGNLVIMSSLDLFSTDYKQVKKITKKLIRQKYVNKHK